MGCSFISQTNRDAVLDTPIITLLSDFMLCVCVFISVCHCEYMMYAILSLTLQWLLEVKYKYILVLFVAVFRITQ